MAPPKSLAECPLCLYFFRYLGKHLITKHGVKNGEERKILLNYGLRRVNIRGLTCPIEGCGYARSRLDTHLSETGHPEMAAGELAKIIEGVKRDLTTKQLRDLRASNPTPPMISFLDLNPAEEDAREGASCSSPPATCRNCQALQADLLQLQKKLRVQAKTLQKKCNRVKYLEEQLQQHQAAGLPGLPPPATHPETSSEEQEDEEDLPPNQEARSSRAGGVLAPFRSLPPEVVQYMESYWDHLKGSSHGRKQQENQRSKLARIHHFLSFLANGGRWSTMWTALENGRRIYEWPEHLRRDGKAVTTIKLYFVNIMEFIGYFKETPPPTSRVFKSTLVAVHRALSSTVSSLGRRVAIRQIQVKRAKLRHLVPKHHLRACRARCREEILCILDKLEKDSTWDLMKFYALFSLYISCVYGHRTGVLQNMTVQEVVEARSLRDEEQDEGFLINVKEHKTNRAFGSAKVYLTQEEFRWLERWLAVRSGLKPLTDLVIFTEGNSWFSKLMLPIQKAWSNLGLPGAPTVTDIRTSIATYARDHLPPDQRMVISGIMCHVSTAEKYYAVDRSCSQLAAIRKTFDGLTDPGKRWGKSSSRQKGAVVVAAAVVEAVDEEHQGEEEEEDSRHGSQQIALDHYEEEVETTSRKMTKKRAVEQEEQELKTP